jgi:hypothetical protein
MFCSLVRPLTAPFKVAPTPLHGSCKSCIGTEILLVVTLLSKDPTFYEIISSFITVSKTIPGTWEVLKIHFLNSLNARSVTPPPFHILKHGGEMGTWLLASTRP